MPVGNLSKRSIKGLVDDLGADDVAVRARAQRELTRRTLEQPDLDDELRALLPDFHAEVDARLRGVLSAGRYYIRVCSVVAFPRSGWWDSDVAFRFGQSVAAIEVTTAPYHLEAGVPRDLGPAGVQVFNSAQHRLIIECGEAIEHKVYLDAIGHASGNLTIRRRCLEGKPHLYWGEASGTRLRFMFKLELESHCGRTPPWSAPCDSGHR
jgi:hypothetical protein